ncbi:cytochrome c [Sphingomonas zeicaulis]|uniref:c-type cytochrome n=1 Tax=Sphingomonas zeicaulis TaxID=1632740 RepID=UPI003D1DED19
MKTAGCRATAIAVLTLLGGCGDSGSGSTTIAGAPAQTGIEPEPVSYASVTGDAKAGERSFLQCKICHTIEADQNRIGPSLYGIIGRKAATVPGFAYSPAMKNSGIIWSEEELFRFIGDTRGTVPGTKMAFAGMRNAQTRADVIAYLKSASK